MVAQRLAPGVQHRENADLSPEMLGVGSDLAQRLGGGTKEYLIDHALVAERHLGKLVGNGEYDMEVVGGQKVSLSRFEPLSPLLRLTLGAVPIAARVVGDLEAAAIGAHVDVPAHLGGTARGEATQDIALAGIHGDTLDATRRVAVVPRPPNSAGLPVAQQMPPAARMPRTPAIAQTYPNGRLYRLPHGRYAPRRQVEDALAQSHAVVDLRRERPSPEAWLSRIVRELRLRFYLPRTIKAYRLALEGLLRWFGQPPHELTREDLRDYLELLVDGGAGASWVSVHLSAVRTAFDKMCGEEVTLGLMTPRRASRLPVVLSGPEVLHLLEAAPALRDKLLLGLMYATGMRVSEVVRLRWRDLDSERGVINVWQGKGRKDRQVMLPESFAPLLKRAAVGARADGFVFPSPESNRHLSPRAAQRVMACAVRLAKIGKHATCHSMRHYAERRIMPSQAAGPT
jgi:site-specific recombinase XerD